MSQNTSLPLSNTHIMVTRPAHQASQLIQLLEAAGATILCQPLIEIVAIAEPLEAIQCVEDLAQTDIAIFISQNAVRHGMDLIQNYAALPDHVKLATVGLGSATLLEQLSSRAVNIMPVKNFNSEGLLAHPELQNVTDKTITIFRGMGGRNLLADTLRSRGAHVHYAEVYQRKQPRLDLQKLANAWQQRAVDYICITSGAGIENLASNITRDDAPPSLRANILNAQLVIVNKRLESLLQKNGFTKPAIITDNVSDNDIVDAIIKHKGTPL